MEMGRRGGWEGRIVVDYDCVGGESEFPDHDAYFSGEEFERFEGWYLLRRLFDDELLGGVGGRVCVGRMWTVFLGVDDGRCRGGRRDDAKT